MAADGAPSSGHVAFIGLAGVGKSAISRRVAAAWGREVVDLDAVVIERAGCPIPQIFKERGEPEFRRLETDALRDAVARREAVVIATGGGVVEAEENRRALAGGARVVLLEASDEVLVDRLRNSSNRRPLLEGDLEANLAALRARRDPLYHATADLVVTVGVHDVAGTTRVVLDAIAERWPDLAVASGPLR